MGERLLSFVERVKNVLLIFDLPSGVVLGIHTLVMISLSVVSVLKRLDIPATVVTIYGMVLGAFAMHNAAGMLAAAKAGDQTSDK